MSESALWLQETRCLRQEETCYNLLRQGQDPFMHAVCTISNKNSPFLCQAVQNQNYTKLLYTCVCYCTIRQWWLLQRAWSVLMRDMTLSFVVKMTANDCGLKLEKRKTWNTHIFRVKAVSCTYWPDFLLWAAGPHKNSYQQSWLCLLVVHCKTCNSFLVQDWIVVLTVLTVIMMCDHTTKKVEVNLAHFAGRDHPGWSW